jgi:uncharacterized protein YeaO (DUF488 family)
VAQAGIRPPRLSIHSSDNLAEADRLRMDLRVKRIYEPASSEDGSRALVDRYWPRGVRKEQAQITRWLRDLAPSAELIAWFGHRPERWEEFQHRYWQELGRDEVREMLDWLLQKAEGGRLTLLYGARDEVRNNAVALAQYLQTHAS